MSETKAGKSLQCKNCNWPLQYRKPFSDHNWDALKCGFPLYKAGW